MVTIILFFATLESKGTKDINLLLLHEQLSYIQILPGPIKTRSYRIRYYILIAFGFKYWSSYNLFLINWRLCRKIINDSSFWSAQICGYFSYSIFRCFFFPEELLKEFKSVSIFCSAVVSSSEKKILMIRLFSLLITYQSWEIKETFYI